MSTFHSLTSWFLYYIVFDDPLPLPGRPPA